MNFFYNCLQEVNKLNNTHKRVVKKVKIALNSKKSPLTQFEVTPEKDIGLEKTLNLEQTNSKGKNSIDTNCLLQEIARLKRQLKKTANDNMKRKYYIEIFRENM